MNRGVATYDCLGFRYRFAIVSCGSLFTAWKLRTWTWNSFPSIHVCTCVAGAVDDDDDTVIQAFVCFSDPDGWIDADV